MAEPATYRRHDLVQVDPSAWATSLAARPDIADLPWVADWATRGRPLMVRRPAEASAAGRISLGLPLPPSAGKHRLAVELALGALSEPQSPPLLSDILAGAPASWRSTLERLVAVDPAVRVFGALAWEALTGLTYLSSGSDVDLLWSAPSRERLAELLDAIGAVEAEAPMWVDGEVVWPDGAAVNWRELKSDADEVLVKRMDGVTTQARRQFLESHA